MRRCCRRDRKVALVLPYLEKAGLVASPARRGCPQARLPPIVEAAGDRIKVAGDILDYADFFTPDDQLPYDEKAFDKRIRKPPEAAELLRKFRARAGRGRAVRRRRRWKELLHDFVEREAIKIGQIIHALRVAVTGKAVGFGMFETLAILGKDIAPAAGSTGPSREV